MMVDQSLFLERIVLQISVDFEEARTLEEKNAIVDEAKAVAKYLNRTIGGFSKSTFYRRCGL